MSDLKVKNCWMFNAAGEASSSNPLGDPEEKVLTESKNAAINLAIFYGNFQWLNSSNENRQALSAYLSNNTTRKTRFMERVQMLQLSAYESAKEFLNAA
jgi:hypothetical protein